MSEIMELAQSAVTADAMARLQTEVAKLPQYEPQTRHYFHGGMYCREVYRDAGVLVVGKVHKKEHFYVITQGRVRIGRDEYSAGAVILSKPGTKRAVLSLEPTTCMTFHRTDATTVEDAERELVEDDPAALYDCHNMVKRPALEVTS